MNKRNYREVYLILNKLGDEYIKKLPPKIYQYIKDNMDSEIDNNRRISKDSISFIAGLHYKYWLQSDEEKSKFLNILNENSEKQNEKYDVKNLFERNENNKENVIADEPEYKAMEKTENEIKSKYEIEKKNELDSKMANRIENKIENNIYKDKDNEDNQKQQYMELIKPEKWYNKVINFFKSFFKIGDKNK